MRLSRPHMARVFALLALFAGIGIGTSFGIVAPASATTCDSSPSTFVDLQSAFAAATSAGTTICLGATIVGPTNDVVTGGNLTIPASANVTLDLSGFDLSITAKTPVSRPAVAGITVPGDSTLQINATGGGSLSVAGATNGIAGGAGIGGNSSYNQHNQTLTTGGITINGGTITAQGGNWAAAIGGGNHLKGGDITINGGNITANAGSGSSAIGGGWDRDGGNVTITGGTIRATAGGNGTAAIGGGAWNHKVSSFIMSGGSLTVLPSPGSLGIYVGTSSPGIFSMSGGTLDVVGTPALYLLGTNNSFTGGSITATANGGNSPAIQSSSSINITGGTLNATASGSSSAAIYTGTVGSTINLPTTGGVAVNAGAGIGTGVAVAMPVVTNVSGSFDVFSMAGSVDATATTPAKLVIQFGVPSSPSVSNSSLAPSSGSSPHLVSTGGTTVSGGTNSSTPEALAATGNNIPYGVVGLLFGLGWLFIFVARRI